MAFSMKNVQAVKQEDLSSSEKQQLEQQILSRVEEQASVIEEQAARLQELEEEHLDMIEHHQQEMAALRQKLQYANEQIERLAGSDIELQQSKANNMAASEKLRHAEKMLEEARGIRKEAGDWIWSAKEKEIKLNDLIEKRAREMAEPMYEEAKRLQTDAKVKHNQIQQQVKQGIETEKRKILKVLQAKEKIYGPYLFVSLSYSILVTWFMSLSSIECRATWQAWLESAGRCLLVIWNWLLGAATWVAQLSQHVPDPDYAAAIHCLIVVGVIGGITIGVAMAIREYGSRFIKFYGPYLSDRLSILVYIGAISGSLFFAEGIQETMHINAIWLAILLSAGYVIIRSLYIVYSNKNATHSNK